MNINISIILFWLFLIFSLHADRKRDTLIFNNIQFENHKCNHQKHKYCKFSFIGSEINLEKAINEIKFEKSIYIDEIQYFIEDYIAFPYGYEKKCVSIDYCIINE